MWIVFLGLGLSLEKISRCDGGVPKGLGAIMSTVMSDFLFTDVQQRAIETIDRSVLVSAAAGSGKTAVLAQRCAHVVCDAPVEQRCCVDELLVLTFTEASAAEMRSRVVKAIRERLERSPDNRRLQEQLLLVDAARISTVHAFCLWLIRRSFNELALDPSFTLLDKQDAAIVRREVLDDLFDRGFAYALQEEKHTSSSVGQDNSESLQAVESETDDHSVTGMTVDDEDAAFDGFATLIDHYGLGETGQLYDLILEIADLATSLTDAQAWLDKTLARTGDQAHEYIAMLLSQLCQELDWQREHCDAAIVEIEQGDPIGLAYAAALSDYAQQLVVWTELVSETEREDVSTEPDAPDTSQVSDISEVSQVPEVPEALGTLNSSSAEESCCRRYDRITQAIRGYEFPKVKTPKLAKDCDPDLRTARDRARDALKAIREKFYEKRLLAAYALFSSEEYAIGLRATQPYVRTIVNLVQAFDREFSARKRQLNVLDFKDLERFAFELLTDPVDRTKPSLIAEQMQQRFKYVLVDEFQDINPIQEAIIRLVCREDDSSQRNNLFVVGDVKQSIYRFRLAEPGIFVDRANRMRQEHGKSHSGNDCVDVDIGNDVGQGNENSEDGDVAISLQHNFRSRGEILDAVNLIFRQLLPAGYSEIVYDEEAELRLGLACDEEVVSEPVELHLLEKRSSFAEEQASDEPVFRGATVLTSQQWSSIEREAYFIGERIKRLIDESKERESDGKLHYCDVVILLRAASVNAEHMAAMLSSMDIPAYADVGGSLFAALETKDILSALQVLDNAQQDLPMASVLRSGVFGEKFNEDEFVEIRCLDRQRPFHACVQGYPSEGKDQALRGRLEGVLRNIEHFRKAVQRRPLPEVLWSLYDKHGYLASVSGLPGGMQRRANLLKLHTLSQKFQTFRRQGVHRFLRFIEALKESDQSMAVAPTVGESEDVVRIMSIHQSKGLEFPFVFLAGLGAKFNLGDRSGRMLTDRNIGIGLRTVDAVKMIEYSSASHRLIVNEVERTTRDEELRILYVAMTRAKRKLILVGSAQGIGSRTLRLLGRAKPGRAVLTRLDIATATNPLDWMLPALAQGLDGQVDGIDDVYSKQPTFRVWVHDQEEMAAWHIGKKDDKQRDQLLKAVSRIESLPSDEPTSENRQDVEELLSRLNFVYPRLAAATMRAAIGVSEAKRLYDERDDWEMPIVPAEDGLAAKTTQSPSTKSGNDEAARRGSLTHRVLQHLDFGQVDDSASVASELQRMVHQRLLDDNDVALVDVASIAWFLTTPLAEEIRQAGTSYRREFSFVARESPALFDRTLGEVEDERVLVRGIVDGVLPGSKAIKIIDFKTDAVDADHVIERANVYHTQMALYARSMAKLWGKPVDRAVLVFLQARQLIEVTDLTL